MDRAEGPATNHVSFERHGTSHMVEQHPSSNAKQLAFEQTHGQETADVAQEAADRAAEKRRLAEIAKISKKIDEIRAAAAARTLDK